MRGVKGLQGVPGFVKRWFVKRCLRNPFFVTPALGVLFDSTRDLPGGPLGGSPGASPGGDDPGKPRGIPSGTPGDPTGYGASEYNDGLPTRLDPHHTAGC